MSDLEIGQRLEALRRHRGLSRERLAALAEVSPILIKSIEKGRRSLTLRTAQRIAPILGVEDLGELYGPEVRLSLDGRPMHPDVPKVRHALTAWRMKAEGTPESADYLRGAVDAAWQTWHRASKQRTEAGAVLPGLIEKTQRAVRLHAGEERRKSLLALADTLHLTQAFLAWHGERELLWLTVDRAVSAAVDADDMIALGWSIFYAAHVLRAVGRADEALEQLQEAVTTVEPDASGGNLDAVELLAALYLCSALTRARVGDQGAWADWDASHAVVTSLLPANHQPRSTFPISRALVSRDADRVIWSPRPRGA